MERGKAYSVISPNSMLEIETSESDFDRDADREAREGFLERREARMEAFVRWVRPQSGLRSQCQLIFRIE